MVVAEEGGRARGDWETDKGRTGKRRWPWVTAGALGRHTGFQPAA